MPLVAAAHPQAARSPGTSPIARNSTLRSLATFAAITSKTSAWLTGPIDGSSSTPVS